MAFIPVPDVVQATLNYLSNDGTVGVNRLYCGTAGVPTETDLSNIGDELYDVWVAQVLPQTSSSWSLTGIHLRAMNEAEGIQHDDANTYPIAGSAVEASDPPQQVSYTVTLNTGLVGRSARGRIYGLGVPTSGQEGTRLTNVYQAALQSAYELVRIALETPGHALQVVSFHTGGVPRVTGRALPVVSLAVRFPLATQRRRLS